MDTSILKGRPVRESRSEYTYVALPNDANALGNLLGGRVMHLVDICGWLAAQRHARAPLVTAAIDQMSFLHPTRIGQLLTLRSSVNRVFRTSMEVGVKVWVEDPQTGEVRHTSSAYLTFVAVAKGGKPVAVAPVIAESEEEERRYDEAGRRREQRLAARHGAALLAPLAPSAPLAPLNNEVRSRAGAPSAHLGTIHIFRDRKATAQARSNRGNVVQAFLADLT